MSFWSDLARRAQDLFSDDDDAPHGAAAADGGTLTIARPNAGCGPDPGDVDFTIAVVGLGAKMAKADGLVSAAETEAFRRIFRAAPNEEAAVRRVFDIARTTVAGYESYARRLARRYRDRPCLLEGVLDALFQIAIADGVMTDDEMRFLRTVSEAFGFSEADFRRIRASHMEPDADDPYMILGVPHEAGFDEIRSAYRRLMLDNHPDTMAVRDAPRTFELVAHDKASAITSAYARIRAERGFLVRPD